ncbi:hypothetical protein A4G31_25405 [Mycobacterium persicum]|nr:hypothetical protein A4G31_25405 [Mycobacterium persicum]
MGPDPGGGGGGPTLISQANAIAATLPAAPRIRPATPAPISAASEKRRRSRPGSASTAGGGATGAGVATGPVVLVFSSAVIRLLTSSISIGVLGNRDGNGRT